MTDEKKTNETLEDSLSGEKYPIDFHKVLENAHKVLSYIESLGLGRNESKKVTRLVYFTILS